MSDPLQVTFSPSYFVDEVREGFYVTGMMKRYWAAQLSVLAEIDKVCKRHGLKWWADNGTLLGAVRHGGYIPWDDDIDIVMMRDDLETFLQVAKDELPKDYALLNVRISDYEYLITQVTNGFVIGLTGEALLRNQGCPYITGVDIFILDGVFPEKEKDEARNALVRDADRAAALVKEGQQESDACKALLKKIEADHGRRLPRDKRLYHALLSLEEDLFSLCPVSDTTQVAQMIFWPTHASHRYEKSWYAETLLLPFENTYLPVPAHYDEVLRTEYDDYMTLYRGGSSHAYPVYGNQEALLKEKSGVNSRRYTFAKEDLTAPHAAPRTERIAQMTALLTKVDAQVQMLQSAGEEAQAQKLLLSVAGMVDALERLERDHKEVVFLVVRAAWWGGPAEEAYRAALQSKDTWVHVVAVPFAERDTDGSVGEIRSDRALFPEELHVKAPEDIDLAGMQADMIVTQFPFDGTQDALLIPEGFWTKHLRQMTDCLVFLPYLSPDTPDDDNETARNALKVFAEQPAFVFADRSVLPSERMAQIVTDALCEIAGRDTRDIWTQKITGKERSDIPFLEEAHAQQGANDKKRLFFYVSAAWLLEHKEQAIRKIGEVLDVFAEHKDNIVPVWYTQEEASCLRKSDEALWEAYDTLQSRFDEMPDGERIGAAQTDDEIARADAFYGCGGVLAHRMRLAKKPVMIMGV